MAYIGLGQVFPFDPTSSGYKQFDAERFSGNGANTAFTLSRKVYSPVDVEVFVENVRQEPTTSYNIVDYVSLTFTEAPPAGTNNIYVIYREVDLRYSVGIPDGSITFSKLANNIRQFTVDEFTANGTGQTFTLSENPASANTLLVSVDGVVQTAPKNYSLSGKTLTFTEAPSASANVVIKHLGFKTTTTVTELPAGSVTTIELADSAVTSEKLANTGVVSGTYGDSLTVGSFTVGDDGRITSASNTTIASLVAYAANSNNGILTTNTSITGNVTIAPNTGGLTIGPAIVAANQTVTISANARWVIL